MKEWIKAHRGQIILNLITILIIGSMLTIYSVKAAPQRQTSPGGFNPGVFSYQGYLSDKNGQPLTGEFPMVFRLYDQPTGGTMLWEEYREGPNQVPVIDGQVNLMLGNITPIPESVWVYPQLYLGIFIGQDGELTPRTLISAVPFAHRASVAQEALSIPNAVVTEANLDLASGTACLQNHVTLQLNNNMIEVPGLNLSFNLNERSRVMIWATGLALPISSASETSVHLLIDNNIGISNIRQNNNWWFPITAMKIYTLEAGNHNLILKGYSSGQADLKVHGIGGFQTCINYLVLGKP